MHVSSGITKMCLLKRALLKYRTEKNRKKKIRTEKKKIFLPIDSSKEKMTSCPVFANSWILFPIHLKPGSVSWGGGSSHTQCILHEGILQRYTQKHYYLHTHTHTHAQLNFLIGKASCTDLKVKAFHLCKGLEDFGGNSCGQHVHLLRVRRVRVRLLPVVQHPPAQQGGELIPCKHLPATPTASITNKRDFLSQTSPTVAPLSKHTPKAEPIGFQCPPTMK